MLAAPLAAMSISSLADIQQGFQAFKDRIYYGETLPPVGSLSLSYAKFLDLLEQRKVKRIILMADGKIAMVEVTCQFQCAASPSRCNSRCCFYACVLLWELNVKGLLQQIKPHARMLVSHELVWWCLCYNCAHDGFMNAIAAAAVAEPAA